MYGIYVKNTRAIKYANAIVGNYKSIETRNKNTLKMLIGKRVAVITSGYIIGYVNIDSVKFCNQTEFRKLFVYHLVPPGSKYDSTKKGKYCYYLSSPEKCTPYKLPSNAGRHGYSYCEF